MMRFLYFLLVPMLALAQIKVSSGKLDVYPDFQSQYISPRTVAVWTPDGYDTQKTYAVLYMQDGQSLFDASTTWNGQEWQVDETAARLMAGQQIQDFIVVAVWNSGGNRHAEYFPQKPFESLTAKQQQDLYALKDGGQPLLGTAVNSENYLKFLVKELQVFVAHTYSIKPGKEHTFIAGSSMGGLISLYALCEYPDVFGGAACLSTHWVGTFKKNDEIPAAFAAYLRRNLPSHLTHKIYFDYGDQTLDALYEPYQKEVDLILMTKGYSGQNWVTKKFPGADHSEKAWSGRFGEALVFLLGR